MKQKLLLPAWVATGILAFAPVLAGQDYSQVVKSLSTSLSASLTKSGKKSVAVVDFTDLQGMSPSSVVFWPRNSPWP
jgi:hypothetical protein